MQQKNNSRFIVDSSVVIAFIHKEPGYDIAGKYIEDGAISAVNFSEILYATLKKGINYGISKSELLDLLPIVINFDTEQASLAASLHQFTKQYGLSLADSACLALGKHMKLPVVTADKIWKELDIGIEVILIR